MFMVAFMICDERCIDNDLQSLAVGCASRFYITLLPAFAMNVGGECALAGKILT